MIRVVTVSIVLAASVFLSHPARADDTASRDPSMRNFRFVYAGTIDKLPPGTSAHVWLPVARSQFAQQVEIEHIDTPAEHRLTVESQYGNSLCYFTALANAQGEIPFEVRYRVKRTELCCGKMESVDSRRQQTFLTASRFIPLDKGLLSQLVPRHAGQPTRRIARQLYEAIDDRMRYDKPLGGDWGRGDAVWACDSRYGNCTDFHSVFIAACREAKVPARFEIGFPLPSSTGTGEVGGYHCWAYFVESGRWIPVDISEADKHPEMKEYYFGNLTADRVAFTVGRDLELNPRQQAGPVNFLVYPHVEVNGKPHTSFVKKFRYEDLEK